MARRRTLKWIHWGSSEGSNGFVVGRAGEEAGSRGVDILTSLTRKPEENFTLSKIQLTLLYFTIWQTIFFKATYSESQSSSNPTLQS